MKKPVFLLFVVFAVIIHGCKKEKECSACFTPPGRFVFDLVDKTTGENLFSNGTFQPREIEVVDLADSSDVSFVFEDEDDVNFIVINTIGWKTEKVRYKFIVSDKYIFSLYVDAERIIDDHCCSYTKYNTINIEDVDYQYVSERGICKILLEP